MNQPMTHNLVLQPPRVGTSTRSRYDSRLHLDNSPSTDPQLGPAPPAVQEYVRRSHDIRPATPLAISCDG